ncbi:MAG: hypothetical protein ACRC5H_04875, partial [Treponemataceae bacterium]
MPIIRKASKEKLEENQPQLDFEPKQDIPTETAPVEQTEIRQITEEQPIAQPEVLAEATQEVAADPVKKIVRPKVKRVTNNNQAGASVPRENTVREPREQRDQREPRELRDQRRPQNNRDTRNQNARPQ